MYKGVEEYLKSQESIESLGITPELNKKIIDGLKTRDVKRKYIATLIKKVR